jgi:hypothetical protein
MLANGIASSNGWAALRGVILSREPRMSVIGQVNDVAASTAP